MRPLDGMRVIALEHAVAAPICSRHLADLGAEVIKIERPGDGDFARGYDSAVYGQSSFFVWLNRGKRSITLDVKQPTAREALQKLVDGADVLLQNLAPGAASRLGFGHADLAPRNPKLVVCDISGYGESGPFAQKKAYDLLIQAESGLISVTGTPETAVTRRHLHRRHRHRHVRADRHPRRPGASRPHRGRRQREGRHAGCAGANG